MVEPQPIKTCVQPMERRRCHIVGRCRLAKIELWQFAHIEESYVSVWSSKQEPVPIRASRISSRLLEDWMGFMHVVGDKIHQNSHSPPVDGLQQFVEGLDGAQSRIYVEKVSDV